MLPWWEDTPEAKAQEAQTTYTRGSASLREGQTEIDLPPLDGNTHDTIIEWMDYIQDKMYEVAGIPARLITNTDPKSGE